jgi:hypothetical protein
VRGRRIWALLAALAVLAVHGMSCMSGSVGSAHVTVAPAVLLSAPAGDSTAFPGGAHRVAALGGDAALLLHLAAGDMPAHGSGISTICLAVLFTALALVGVATLFRRRAPLLVRGPPPSLPRLRLVYRLPPAPDLSALCLLRI